MPGWRARCTSTADVVGLHVPYRLVQQIRLVWPRPRNSSQSILQGHSTFHSVLTCRLVALARLEIVFQQPSLVQWSCCLVYVVLKVCLQLKYRLSRLSLASPVEWIYRSPSITVPVFGPPRLSSSLYTYARSTDHLGPPNHLQPLYSTLEPYHIYSKCVIHHTSEIVPLSILTFVSACHLKSPQFNPPRTPQRKVFKSLQIASARQSQSFTTLFRRE